MRSPPPRPVSGHNWRREGRRGPAYHAKYRFPDGRQRQQRIGPTWTAPADYFTKARARARLDVLLVERQPEVDQKALAAAAISRQLPPIWSEPRTIRALISSTPPRTSSQLLRQLACPTQMGCVNSLMHSPFT
jgi:hypothetical protein